MTVSPPVAALAKVLPSPPGSPFLRAAALLLLATAAALPALAFAIAYGSDVVVLEHAVSFTRGMAVAAVALGLHPLLRRAHPWAAAVTAGGVLGGMLAALGTIGTLAIELLALDLPMVAAVARASRGFAWFVLGFWLLGMGGAPRGEPPLDADSRRVAAIAGAGIVFAATMHLGRYFSLETHVLGSSVAALIVTPALAAWLLRVAQLTRGLSAAGFGGYALPRARTLRLSLGAAFVTSIVVSAGGVSGLDDRVVLATALAFGLALSVVVLALHARINMVMSGARVVTAMGLLATLPFIVGSVMGLFLIRGDDWLPTWACWLPPLLGPSLVLLAVPMLAGWLLIVGWLAWRRLILDRSTGELAIIAGYAWFATALLADYPSTLYFAVLAFVIAAGALILWTALAWGVVGTEIRSTAGPA